MIEKAQIAGVLGRLREVEAAMGDPAVIADAKRSRETVREHTALRKLEAASRDYFKIIEDIEGNETLLGDPDFAAEAKDETEE